MNKDNPNAPAEATREGTNPPCPDDARKGDLAPSVATPAQLGASEALEVLAAFQNDFLGFNLSHSDMMKWFEKVRAALSARAGGEPTPIDWPRLTKGGGPTFHERKAERVAAAAPAQPLETVEKTVHEIELLAHASGLKGPADAWTILRSAITSALASSTKEPT